MSEFDDRFARESVHQSNKAEDPLFAPKGLKHHK
jgi:hypothetical protein